MVLEGDEILFGADATTNVVAVELSAERDDEVILFRREKGKLVRDKRSFEPFALLQNPEMARKLDEDRGQVRELEGDLPLRVLVSFAGWSACVKARAALPKLTGKNASDPLAPYFCPNDPIHQFMLRSGVTCFKGMDFQDPIRLQLDIETRTSPGFTFPNPDRAGDEILSVAVRDNGGGDEVVLWGPDLGERLLLEQLSEIILERDPDVIEGHNLFKFDLAYLFTRAKRHKVRLRWGRDGSVPSCRSSRVTIAERTVDYPRMDIYGRSVLDTWITAQMADVSSRDMESYGLKDLARQLGIAAPNRTYVAPEEIETLAGTDPERLKAYNLDDTREVAELSELLGGSAFVEAKVCPYSYQNVMVRGSATKLNALFVREYLRAGHSIPLPSRGGAYEGGYTDIFFEGVAREVVHCDVQSLYPSIMLTMHLEPSKDPLKVFSHLLSKLRTFRLQCKNEARLAASPKEKRHMDAMQQAFKILINSFYGYLGTDLHNFSDPSVASRVTAVGRDLLKGMVDWLRKESCEILELDTDGIYFVPRPDARGEEAEAALVERLSRTLPEGIKLEYDGRYEAMFSYKRKNYALLGADGTVMITGSGLRSRGIEPYLRHFMRGLLEAILKQDAALAESLYVGSRDRIARHENPLKDFCKTETLSETLEAYQSKVGLKKRNRAAAYELALQSGRPFVPGDLLIYYITGQEKRVKAFEKARLLSDTDPDHRDENVAYYLDKLDEVYEKFKGYLPPQGTREDPRLVGAV